MAAHGDIENGESQPKMGCSIKLLPEDKWESAAAIAVEHNAANAPNTQFLRHSLSNAMISPSHLFLMTSKYWGNTGVSLTVSFLDNPPSAPLRARIVSHMNAWGAFANVKFVEVTSGGQVRIARRTGREEGGYWSYLGTDILSIGPNEPTMNLEGFRTTTPESTFRRVVRHETGHTLGFPHEHMTSGIVSRIDPEKAYEYFKETEGWEKEDVDDQVLTPLQNSALLGTTAADPESIMCYPLPAEIMKDGLALPGSLDINAQDGQFAGSIYPKHVNNVAAAP